MKAYQVTEPYEGNGVLAFADSSAAARRLGANELNIEFGEVESCRRAPWADEYAPGPVPIHAFIANGWWFECSHCGCRMGAYGRSESDGGSEGDYERDDEFNPVRVGRGNYCSPTCAQMEWAERQDRMDRDFALIEACETRFPGAAYYTPFRGGSSEMVGFIVPGASWNASWEIGSKHIMAPHIEQDLYRAWVASL